MYLKSYKERSNFYCNLSFIASQEIPACSLELKVNFIVGIYFHFLLKTHYSSKAISVTYEMESTFSLTTAVVNVKSSLSRYHSVFLKAAKLHIS